MKNNLKLLIAGVSMLVVSLLAFKKVNAFEEVLDVAWQRDDISFSIVVGPDSSSIEIDTDYYSGDAFIKKYDRNGQLAWQKSWGGNRYDSFETVTFLPDGSIIVLATSDSTDIPGLTNKGSEDAVIIKYDQDGNLLWQKSWGGNDYDGFSRAEVSSDGSITIFGTSYSTDIPSLANRGGSDIIAIKYDQDGNLLWQNMWGGRDYDSLSRSIVAPDGSTFIIVSSSSTTIPGIINKGRSDVIIVKYDQDGNLAWQTSWGGNNYDSVNSAEVASDGSLFVTISSTSTNISGLANKGKEDAILVKYDQDGNLIWQKSWGGNNNDSFSIANIASDGSILIAGSSYSTDIPNLANKGQNDAILVKYDQNGNLVWQKSWGGNSSDYFDAIVINPDDSFAVIIRSSSTDIPDCPNNGDRIGVVMIYDQDGNLVWQKSHESFYGNFSFDLILLDTSPSFIVVDRGEFKSSITKYSKFHILDIDFTILSEDNPEGFVTPEPIEDIVWETEKELIITPSAEGWTFSGWFVDEACTELLDFNKTPTDDLHLYGRWNKNEDDPVIPVVPVVPNTGINTKSDLGALENVIISLSLIASGVFIVVAMYIKFRKSSHKIFYKKIM